MAKFEVCCHKWADLSEYGYGVSILNDSKYGFATSGNMMRLSLLRAPKAPDAHADLGRHTIRYAILPHAGPLDSRTVRAGYNFNNPLALESAKFKEADNVFDPRLWCWTPSSEAKMTGTFLAVDSPYVLGRVSSCGFTSRLVVRAADLSNASSLSNTCGSAMFSKTTRRNSL